MRKWHVHYAGYCFAFATAAWVFGPLSAWDLVFMGAISLILAVIYEIGAILTKTALTRSGWRKL